MPERELESKVIMTAPIFLIETDECGLKLLTQAMDLFVSVNTGAFTKILDFYLVDENTEIEVHKLLDEVHTRILSLPASKNVRVADLGNDVKGAFGLWLELTQNLLDANKYLDIEIGGRAISSLDSIQFKVSKRLARADNF